MSRSPSKSDAVGEDPNPYVTHGHGRLVGASEVEHEEQDPHPESNPTADDEASCNVTEEQCLVPEVDPFLGATCIGAEVVGFAVTRFGDAREHRTGHQARCTDHPHRDARDGQRARTRFGRRHGYGCGRRTRHQLELRNLDFDGLSFAVGDDPLGPPLPLWCEGFDAIGPRVDRQRDLARFEAHGLVIDGDDEPLGRTERHDVQAQQAGGDLLRFGAGDLGTRPLIGARRNVGHLEEVAMSAGESSQLGVAASEVELDADAPHELVAAPELLTGGRELIASEQNFTFPKQRLCSLDLAGTRLTRQSRRDARDQQQEDQHEASQEEHASRISGRAPHTGNNGRTLLGSDRLGNMWRATVAMVFVLGACNPILGIEGRDLADGGAGGTQASAGGAAPTTGTGAGGASTGEGGSGCETCGGSECVDLMTDGANCGACAHDCLGGTCSGGTCAPVAIYPGVGQVFFAVDDGDVFWSERTMAPQHRLWGGSVTGAAPTELVQDGKNMGATFSVGATWVTWLFQGTSLYRVDRAGGTPASVGVAMAQYQLNEDSLAYFVSNMSGGMLHRRPVGGADNGTLQGVQGNAPFTHFGAFLYVYSPSTPTSVCDHAPCIVRVSKTNVGNYAQVTKELEPGANLAPLEMTADADALYWRKSFSTLYRLDLGVPNSFAQSLAEGSFMAMAPDSLPPSSGHLYFLGAPTNEPSGLWRIPKVGGSAELLVEYEVSGQFHKVYVDDDAVYFRQGDDIMKLARPLP